MKRFTILFLLAMCMLTSNVYAQSTVRIPEYQTVMIPDTICRDVVVDRGPNVAGTVIGAVVGYAIGREIDRGSRGYGYYNHGRYYNDRHHGGYYRDNYRHGHYRYRDSRGGRIGGTVVGGVIGSQVGRGHTVERVCEQVGVRYSEQLVGYRVITTYPNGTTRERFEPVR